MRMDYLMMLKNIKDEIIEERQKAQDEAEQQAQSGTSYSNSFSTSSLQSMASKYGVKLPSSMGSFHL